MTGCISLVYILSNNVYTINIQFFATQCTHMYTQLLLFSGLHCLAAAVLCPSLNVTKGELNTTSVSFSTNVFINCSTGSQLMYTQGTGPTVTSSPNVTISCNASAQWVINMYTFSPEPVSNIICQGKLTYLIFF